MTIEIRGQKFLIRFTVLFLLILMIKGFDNTYGGLLEISFRGQFFGWYFLVLWMATWYMGEGINRRLKKVKQPYKLLLHALFAYSIALATNLGYKYGDIYLFNHPDPWKTVTDFNPEFTMSLLLIYLIIYGTDEYLNYKLLMHEEQAKTEKLAKENVQAKYMALKNQIEPHFLFNSLSVLSSIMHSDIDQASEFLARLSRTLRYIIEKNEFTLVSLNEELLVVNDYYFLLKTRFPDGIGLSIDCNNNDTTEIYIPPATLQLLIENAVKHNKLSKATPLQIEISLNSGFIVVKNTLNRRNTNKQSTRIGLQNIQKRYELISMKDVVIDITTDTFLVKLPILTKSHYENFNH